MAIQDEIAGRLSALVAAAQAKLTDGASVRDVFEILGDAISLAVRVAQDFAEVPGPEKKAAVTQAVMAFYTAVVEPLDIPWVPDVVVDPLLRGMVEKLVDGLIESLVRMFHEKGWLAA